MTINTILFIVVFIYSCQPVKEKQRLLIERSIADTTNATENLKSYDDLKQEISKNKRVLAIRYPELLPSSGKIPGEVVSFWVNTISVDLFKHWQNTPWDFNGTTTKPKQGTIACGFFVTTILQHMGVKINRTKLAVCASAEMMKTIVPRQGLKNMSFMNYSDFNEALKEKGTGVYIIGLDYHTGFIVHDATELWFIHSNYIQRKGVTKESVLHSLALKSSKTRWLISLTNDTYFLQNWLQK